MKKDLISVKIYPVVQVIWLQWSQLRKAVWLLQVVTDVQEGCPCASLLCAARVCVSTQWNGQVNSPQLRSAAYRFCPRLDSLFPLVAVQICLVVKTGGRVVRGRDEWLITGKGGRRVRGREGCFDVSAALSWSQQMGNLNSSASISVSS